MGDRHDDERVFEALGFPGGSGDLVAGPTVEPLALPHQRKQRKHGREGHPVGKEAWLCGWEVAKLLH